MMNTQVNAAGIGKSAVIMGIDPGLASTGVGVIAPDGDGGWKIVFSAHSTSGPSTPMPDRLEIIHRLVSEAVEAHKPTVVALESIFFARNVKSAVLMAHGRGAAILAISLRGIPLVEYSPLEIKQSVIGKGRGSKEQVKQMVTVLLNLKDV
ncbi:MAG: crossover junction endodeoxyribonuclease RuvC, partial [Candidatus Sumerlaeia bacterium]|nr:crossover junction endodeoxyribonuclease RuvC [Candidatus Sumerlaeia bacterium]